MQKRILSVFAILALTGCPYSEGCDGSSDTPPETTGDDGGDQGEGGSDEASTDAGTDGPPREKSAPIDFGTPTTGGPKPSTLTCPTLAMPLPGGAPPLYVDANATGAETGTRDAPFKTIAKAFAAARQAGVVYVAAGTYKENLSIPDKDLVVFGGFAPGFGSRTNACATILEAATPTVPVLSASFDVLSFGLEGVTVQKGARGILVTGDETVQASFTIARSVFKENGTKTEVGGAAALDGVNARIFQSVFVDNLASKGAAIAHGGDTTITVDECLVDKNVGHSDHGGALYLSGKLSRISRNTFKSNVIGAGIPVGFGGNWGGAIIVYKQAPSKPARGELSYNVFTDNLAGLGAAVFADEGATVTMSHDLVYRNRAYLENGYIRGAALYVDGTGEPGGGSTFVGEYLTVANNVLDENRVNRASTAFGGNIYVETFSKATIKNSIFWNNGNDAFYLEANNEITVSHTIGAPSCTSSNNEGLIPASPTICKIGAGVFLPPSIEFVNEAADDYHEKSAAGHYANGVWVNDGVTSPAIDKGDPASGAGSEPAPNGGRSNIGAYAQTSEASKTP
ncbi:MAG: DUF1565 domain-containing protein [Deltaproteobacteria bacterium]|nr:DUF1565 domain-containing protein [Deltaproteobacteria bacterium]